MRRLLLGVCLGAIAAGAASAQTGQLVIAGGAVDPKNDALYGAFIAAAAKGAADPGAPRFLIVPTASIEPAASAAAMIRHLTRRGVLPEQIAVAKVAVVDDPTTPDVDERLWRDGALSPTEVAKVTRADGVWFVGGDQSRIIAGLKTPEGGDTPLLTAIRARWSSGAAVGGTSAGAAMMSRPMILAGDGPAAVVLPLDAPANPLGEALSMGEGLGFFTFGLVDQHFDRRQRLGRLARALGTLPASERLGFGVDENTAFVVDPDRASARVVGAGAVSVLDARHALTRPAEPFAMDGAHLSILTDGDSIDLGTLAVQPAPDKSASVAAVAARPARSRLETRIGALLLGAKPGTVVQERLVVGKTARVVQTFRRSPGTLILQSSEGARAPRTTLIDVIVSIASLSSSSSTEGRP